jgi:hypothetical protein
MVRDPLRRNTHNVFCRLETSKEDMRKLIGSAALVFALIPFAHAEETVGDKAREAKSDAVQAKRSAGKEIRQAGRAVKSTGRKARQAVITRCADGRHTIKGKAGCRGHGGVRDPK